MRRTTLARGGALLTAATLALSLGALYQLSRRSHLGLFTEYTRLIGDAEDSPLVQVGSPNQITGGVGLIFSF